MVLCIQFLLVQAFPPLPFVIFGSKLPVVMYTSYGAILSAAALFRTSSTHAPHAHLHRRTDLLFGCRCPAANQILFRSYSGAVPFVVTALIQVKIIMVFCPCHKIFGASLFIQCDRFVRVPFLSLPAINNTLKAKLRKMAVFFTMIGILVASFLVHPPAHTSHCVPAGIAAPNAPRSQNWHP